MGDVTKGHTKKGGIEDNHIMDITMSDEECRLSATVTIHIDTFTHVL